ncbi:DNA sulfur modification protein DndB [Pengzhenrongella sp.]|uniref:DNA sulfur modification protein DndB n=1 Tax=Pengzhenrongella sp. TaxID=2888820 RepID=UPI002F94D3B3
MTFPAFRFERGGFRVLVVAVPLRVVPELLPVPDPLHKFPGNRRVDGAHAEGFARYWSANERWATPPLLLDTAIRLSDSFTLGATDGPVESGILEFPDDSTDVLEILDGQHRILGWHIAAKTVDAGLASARRARENAHVLGDAAGAASAATRVADFERLEVRLERECITLEIYEGVTPNEHRQFFSDIATNAKGITKSQVAAFDQRDLVNRIAADLASRHPLVRGAVDFEKDRMAGASENFLSAKTLVDVIRAASIGFESRITQKREALLDGVDVAAVTTAYLDLLIDEVPGLEAVAAGELSVANLRSRSLIASATVLRCLAGAFRLVAVAGINDLKPRVDASGEEDFRRLLRQLHGSWGFPLDSRWLASGYFPRQASKAPSSRAQDLKGLTATLARWAQDGVPPIR